MGYDSLVVYRKRKWLCLIIINRYNNIMVSIPKEDILVLIGKYLAGVGEERLAKKVFKRSGW